MQHTREGRLIFQGKKAIWCLKLRGSQIVQEVPNKSLWVPDSSGGEGHNKSGAPKGPGGLK